MTIAWTSYKQWLESTLLSPLPENQPCPLPGDLSTNSRTLQSGQWFLPLKGTQFDGHDYIEEAIKNGAAGTFSERQVSSTVPMILVKNTLDTYHSIAGGWRSTLPSIKTVALTGSLGKTTVKTMTSLMLATQGETFSTPGNQNNEFGIPKSVLNLKADHKFSVFELGARHPNDISTLVKIVQPNVSACLNIASPHQEIFGCREMTMNTKLEILKDAPPQCKGVVLYDDPTLLEKAKKIKKDLITFGFDKRAAIFIQSHHIENEMLLVGLNIFGKNLEVSLSLYHESFPINLAAAFAITEALGVSSETCVKGLEHFKGLPGRFKIHRRPSYTVVDDSYNASPESMKAGIKSLFKLFPKRKKVLILGEMFELGPSSDKKHREIGSFCAQEKPDFLVTVGNHARLLADEAEKRGFPKKSVQRFDDVSELLDSIHSINNKGDLFYVKGSRKVQLDLVVAQLIS
ncbi:MAG: UDP-N-acetylmuramoyl-tripeptide--D-alanyl-D-alanine ligase [Deltaproteobacteria bacterium]|nr:UDP-N-acetylmuramoyl-tripeptide--D-alanyl-D-alanine ligase [Deltaproteobacteria bacterium]